MKKINVIKFVPYFPPHKGGLESHVMEWSEWWLKKGYGEVINVTTLIGQEKIINSIDYGINNINKIIYKNVLIGYHINGYQVLILDSFDIIEGFPFPKFWSKKFRISILYLQLRIKNYSKENIILNTHTRFFLTSLVGGIYAKLFGIKRIHIEHGVDFVKLSNKFKTYIAYLYDQTFGRYILRNADIVIGISNGCKNFVNQFTNKNVPVIHRGMNFQPKTNRQGKGIKKIDDYITIGFVGRIVKLKGLEILLKVFEKLHYKYTNLRLEIVGDGDQLFYIKEIVKNLSLDNFVIFHGFKESDFIANDFLPRIDIVVNPSYQEGLPTSVLEGLLSKCVVVATNVGGTSEISIYEDLILVNKGDIISLQVGIEHAINNYTLLKGLSYEYVKSNFNWEKSIEKYYNIYQTSLLGNKKTFII